MTTDPVTRSLGPVVFWPRRQDWPTPTNVCIHCLAEIGRGVPARVLTTRGPVGHVLAEPVHAACVDRVLGLARLTKMMR